MIAEYALKAAYPLGGAVLGYSYYYFIGCSTGACPITASPVSSTIYGLIIGLVLSMGR